MIDQNDNYFSDRPYTDPIFLKHINKPIKTIVELGCNNYVYTYDLLNTYNPDVLYAFEAHPDCIRYCMANTKDKRIKLVNKAVADYDGHIDFYDFNNITGCASVFERDYLKDHQKPKVQIPCTRLDSFFSDNKTMKIDLLCMDIQGAELMALHGLGEMVQSVSYIMLEIPKNNKVVHKSAPTRSEILNFLVKKGFTPAEIIRENDWEDNALFLQASVNR